MYKIQIRFTGTTNDLQTTAYGKIDVTMKNQEMHRSIIAVVGSYAFAQRPKFEMSTPLLRSVTLIANKAANEPQEKFGLKELIWTFILKSPGGGGLK